MRKRYLKLFLSLFLFLGLCACTASPGKKAPGAALSAGEASGRLALHSAAGALSSRGADGASTQDAPVPGGTVGSWHGAENSVRDAAAPGGEEAAAALWGSASGSPASGRDAEAASGESSGLFSAVLKDAGDSVPLSPPAPGQREKGVYYEGDVFLGKAVWYGNRHHGRRTSSRKKMNHFALMAAHRTLPLGSIVSVTNLRNNLTVLVEICDRGPRSKKYIIDLSRHAAEEIGMRRQGIGDVSMTIARLPKEYVEKHIPLPAKPASGKEEGK